MPNVTVTNMAITIKVTDTFSYLVIRHLLHHTGACVIYNIYNLNSKINVLCGKSEKVEKVEKVLFIEKRGLIEMIDRMQKFLPNLCCSTSF